MEVVAGRFAITLAMEVSMILALFATLAATAMLALLLVRLVIYALPVFAALIAGQWAHASGFTLGHSIALGLVTAVAILLAAQLALSLARTPLQLGMIGMAFALPTALAGYQAAQGIWSIFAHAGAVSTVPAGLAALLFAGLALAHLPRPARVSTA